MPGSSPIYLLITTDDHLPGLLQACLPEPVKLEVLAPDQLSRRRIPVRSTVFVDCLPPAKEFFWPSYLRDLPISLIMICAQGDMERVKMGVLHGAHSYITSPLSPPDVQRVVKQCCSELALEVEDEQLPADEQLETSGFYGMLGVSSGMKSVFRLIQKISRSNSNVLIQGESGTGKELVARAIHNLSARAKHPFIPVNCAAIPRELLESELFGYVKGAFTGAIYDRPGRVEMADGGGLFLDEIGEMDALLQVKILRLIQDRTVEPLGWRQAAKKIDIRIICATNRDLEMAVREGDFREDLFFRLNVVPVQLPPLRQRPEDIPCLVEYFIHCQNEVRSGLPVTDISPEALLLLQSYPWPGNVRELENIIERIMVMKSGGSILPADLPEKIVSMGSMIGKAEKASRLPLTAIPAEGLSLKTEVSKLEKQLIVQALQQSQGVKERAARLLKMNRTTLIEKIKRNRINADTLNGGEDPA